MSKIINLVILLVIIPVYARGGRGGGGHHGGGYHGGSHGGSHHYPASTGLSGTHSHNYGHSDGVSHSVSKQSATYPQSPGLSGNDHHTTYVHKTEVHHHYNPPQQINYGSGYHPVYQMSPPVYVYQYRDSGSRFDTLLTGLALYNLGRMSSSHHSDHHYSRTPGEVCKLGIRKNNGDYQETRIDCQLMSSFIWEEEKKKNSVVKNTVTITVNTTRVDNIDSTNSNGTVVTSTTTVQNKTVVDALEVKGPSIQVTPGMTCFMIRISRDTSILKKNVECGLLQAYAQHSFRNGAGRNVPLMPFLLGGLIIISYF